MDNIGSQIIISTVVYVGTGNRHYINKKIEEYQLIKIIDLSINKNIV